MTKKVKGFLHWYYRARYWEIIGRLITPLAVGGAGITYVVDAHPFFYGLGLGFGGILYLIRILTEDKNKDGIIDIVQDLKDYGGKPE